MSERGVIRYRRGDIATDNREQHTVYEIDDQERRRGLTTGPRGSQHELCRDGRGQAYEHCNHEERAHDGEHASDDGRYQDSARSVGRLRVG